MNFKLTKTKLIVASILGVVVGILLFLARTWIGTPPDNYLWLKFKSGIAGLAIAFALTYVIYSLIQRKK